MITLTAQVTYTADDTVAVYPGPFGFGSNMGWFPPWSDKELAEIAAGNPAKGIQGQVFEAFALLFLNIF